VKVKQSLLVLASLVLIACFIFVSPSLAAENTAKPEGTYTFSSDWFSHNILSWTRILSGMKGRPGLTYLEIGAWEGRSFFWILDTILTHPSSKAIAIDIFDGDVEQRFLDNLRRSGRSSDVQVIKGFSQQKLRDLVPNSIDLIYIDGDHTSKGVLMDAILSWDLIKDGGIIILDDYRLFSGLPMETRPEFAIDVFLTLFRDEIEVLLKDYQVIVRKNKTPCDETRGFITRLENKMFCSRLGQYVYYWKLQKLFNVSTNKEISLTKADVSMIENTLLFQKLGFRLDVEKKETDQYRNLLNRLGINEISLSSKEK
jgi:predicted O-methyltransferase YrrM